MLKLISIFENSDRLVDLSRNRFRFRETGRKWGFHECLFLVGYVSLLLLRLRMLLPCAYPYDYHAPHDYDYPHDDDYPIRLRLPLRFRLPHALTITIIVTIAIAPYDYDKCND